MSNPAIPVLEVFGPTIQGEGMSIGRRTMFVRTSGCDYRCVWCDSAFTWDGSGRGDLRLLQPEEIWDELYRLGGEGFDHVTLSGGNPALLPQLGGLVALLHEKGIRTAVETQGSVWQDWALAVDEVTVSPKPPSSRMETDLPLLDAWIGRLTDRSAATTAGASPAPVGLPSPAAAQAPSVSPASTAQPQAFSLKVVVFDEADLDYAAMIHRRYPHVPLFIQTGNPLVGDEPAASVAERLLTAYESLIGQVTARPDLADVRILPQLHALVWGNKRGV